MLIALLFSLLLHTLTSCRKSLIGNGPLETRTTETEAFRAIALAADFVVHVRTAPVPRLIIRAQENVHPWISAENDKGILKLGYRTGIRVLKHEPVEITVEGPACGEYTVSGSGQIGRYRRVGYRKPGRTHQRIRLRVLPRQPRHRVTHQRLRPPHQTLKL